MVTTKRLFLACLIVLASNAYGDQGSLTNSGGSLSAGSSIIIGSTVSNPPGSLSVNCPITQTNSGEYAITYLCAGGSFSFLSNDGNTALNASVISGTATYTCSGGGKGGHTSCGYAFTATFSGALALSGQVQAIIGATNQSFASTGGGSGASGYNSAYSPFYFSNGTQILKSDDLLATNLAAFGKTGTGVGQFNGPAGLALDAAGRIYIADTYNCRVVRMDDMTGKNWATYGTCGSGQGQFASPTGVFVDSAGKIYVADTLNYRIVRVDDLTGTNWVAFGASGSGVNQFGPIGSVAVDPAGHIYIADAQNKRLVRIDDMTGTNWTALLESPDLGGYIYPFQSPTAVTLDPAGEIYIADSTVVIRVDDMTGTNWTEAYTGINTYPIQVSADTSGTLFESGPAVTLIDSMAGVIASAPNLFGNLVNGIAPIPEPSPRPAAIRFGPGSLTFGNLNIANTSPSQPVTINNFGGSPLELSNVEASGEFVATNGCGATVVAGSTCTVSVSFAPTVTGAASGVLTLTDNSGNSGTTQQVTLSGTGTEPTANVFPGIMTFLSQALNTASASQSVLLVNTGTGPLQINSIAVSAPFSQTNNCGASIAAATGCTVQVSFTPTASGAASATLTLSDTIGTQTVTLTGTGVTAAPVVTVSPASLLFPKQLINTKSPGQVVTLMNGGATTVSVSGLTISGAFAETTTCGTTLKAGKKCNVTVTFAPTATGGQRSSLTFNLSTGAQTIALNGIGVTGTQPSLLTLSPPVLDFTGYVVGDNPTKNITVTNANGVLAGVSSITFSGNSVFTEKNKCPSILAPAATCSISVTFAPKKASTFTGTVTVNESNGTVDTIPVSGSASTSGG
jgi:sugar lactone lactonase YvrE